MCKKSCWSNKTCNTNTARTSKHKFKHIQKLKEYGEMRNALAVSADWHTQSVHVHSTQK
jgi:hypothetical protein